MSAPLTASNIANHAVSLVAALGPDTVFSLTGGMAMHLNRAVAAHPGLRAVYCQHEQAAVAAAEGYAKASDFRRPGFAVVTAGPGVSNTITSLISANGDSVPLIVLAGQIKREDIDPFGVRTHGIQEAPSRAIVSPCVKRFLRLDVDGFREALVEALAEAFSGRPGPVFIEIPLDVQGTPIDLPAGAVAEDARRVMALAAARRTKADAAELQAAVDFLLEGERPLLYVGNGCRIAGVEEAVRVLIARHDLPAVFSWLSFDILPADDTHHFGCPGGLAPISANRILGRADRILFLGARLDLGTTAFQRAAFGDQATRIFVDVDGAELKKFAALADSRIVEADLRALPDVKHAHHGMVASAWVGWCIDQRADYMIEEARQLGGETFNVYAIAGVLSPWCADRVVVPASSGYAEETLTRFWAPPAGSRFFNGAALGAMGLGLPMALGAAFGSGRKVVCVDADGGVMLNIQELATLKSQAPAGFVLFILNNDGYESIRSSQQRHFGGVFGADQDSGLFIPPFGALSSAFGLAHRRIETMAELKAFLAAHDDAGPPVVVELIIPPFESRGPGVKTFIQPDGRPITTPLAEIDW
jgi:acetolactate synthase-1/2/3 large subunit